MKRKKPVPPAPPKKTTHYFPEPDVTADGKNKWRKRRVREWIAGAAGEPPPPPRPDDEYLVSQAVVQEMVGGVSRMWIIRHRAPKAPAVA